MRKQLLFICVIASAVILAGCNNDIAAKEFKSYNDEDMEPLEENAYKLQNMKAEMESLIQGTEAKGEYIQNNMLSLLEEIITEAEEIQDRLQSEEVKKLNDLSIQQLDSTHEVFEKLAEVFNLQTPPVSDQDQKKSEEIYSEVQTISSDIQEITEEHDQYMSELEDKYNGKGD
ncbi:hypothetical protein [Lentibacillus salicampi]|uniref:NDxxF motif lipoprotein n=1 Tax=Lentibacillus salicampi TaxID=175306 RepID=A0A4Y9AA97_9BACI|nr:hypothetical protein [Lentibacillus salicampi]TFJ91284.1 hypothetical protein E4U82_18500 [Lentibacillus salicampi]